MSRRTSLELTVVPLLCANIACQAAASDPVKELAVGDRMPPDLVSAAPSHAEPFLVWAFRTRDCLRCAHFDREVRRALSMHSPAMELIGLHIGSADQNDMIRAYFESMRLAPRLVHLPERGLRKLGMEIPTPSMIIVHRDTVQWLGLIANAERLDSVMSQLLK